MQVSSRGSGIAVATGVAAALVATFATAESEVRPLSGFNSVGVSGGIDLNIRLGDEFRVEAINPDGSPEDIITTVEDGTLIIRRSRTSGWFDWNDDYSVNVTLPELAGIAASGGSEVRAEGTIAGGQLSISASGGSDIAVAVDVASVEVAISGGAEMTLSGTATSASIQASGGSDVDARELSVAQAVVQSSGGADIAVGGVSEQLVAQASGGSDIVYSGDPTTDIATSGGAEVTRR